MQTAEPAEQPGVTDLPATPLVIDVDGFEGPLDLLLELARRQKVDLARISVLALAEQYLAFIAAARDLRLELAGDYLVMAAWLAYLKSRLLLPRATADAPEPSGEELALALAERLRRLEQIRLAAASLAARPQLGRDVQARGAGEQPVTTQTGGWHATLHDLLAAYAAQRRRQSHSVVAVGGRQVCSLAEARDALERWLGATPDWATLDAVLGALAGTPAEERSLRASAFAAALEMAREGDIDLAQAAPLGPLLLRRRAGERPAQGARA